MLYLNSEGSALHYLAGIYLTLTNVVFEFNEENGETIGRINLTLTNVVFEYPIIIAAILNYII